MANDLVLWLEGCGLGRYAQAFTDNGIGLDVLSRLSEDDFKELGLNLGDRRRLQAALEESDPATEQPTRTFQPEAERRQVTVLFADICGYTQMSNELDAEEIHATLSHFIDRADAIIYDHGGTVDKHVGDSVMAVFGAPVAHSDDSVRAARAAMAIHEAMPAVSEQAGRKLQVHIGIASGQVVASGVGKDAHYTVTGESVNLASRLTDAASPGETLISARVQNAVGQVVECEHHGVLTIKGFADPVPAYAIKGQRKQAATGTGRSFVGRQAEIHQFAGALAACAETGAGQAVYIRGEAGIGKTRLTEEFERIAIDQGFDCHRALVLDFGVGRGQGAIHALVQNLLAIPPGSGETALMDAAEEVFANGLLDRGQAMYLNDLLDLPQPPELRSLYGAMDNAVRNQGKRETLAALVQAQCDRRPVLLIIEDLHWADGLFIEQLAGLAQSISNSRAILAMTSRIEGDPLDQAWRLATAATPFVTIDLRPLRQDDAMRLAGCVERADGNPLFLEQLLRSAEAAGDEGDESVPDSVQSVIQARMDSLEILDKQALLAASVLGQRFSLDALRQLISSPHYDCSGLIEHYLVRPEGDDYLFAHALVKEGVYNSLLKARRTELHREAADWYGAHDQALRAEHLDRAADPGAGAAYYHAAEAEAAALRLESALRMADRGIELVEDPAIRCDLMCLRADALRDMGATDKSIAAFEAALECAPDGVHRCRAWIGLAGGLRIADRQTEALEILRKAEESAREHGLVSECAQIHYLRGNVYFPLGNIEGCLAEHEKALGFAREAGSAEGEALALGGLGDGYYLRGHMRSACERFRACVELCSEHGYGRIEVANRHMVGWTRIYLMEFAEALEDGLEAATMAARVSHHRAEMLGLMLAGRIELELGHFVEAQKHFNGALDLARMLSAGNFEAQSLVLISRLCAVQGEHAEARRFAEQAVGVVRNVGLTFIGPAVLAQLAALTTDEVERKATLREAEEILDTGCVAHNHFWFAFTAIDQALAAGEWDEADRYATRLETYTREQPLPWPDFMIARGRALASWGRGGRDESLVMELKRLHEVAEGSGMNLAASGLEQALATSTPA
ncbi:MAG: adenylate/guanylate cyclase domain-containing protein [Alphaproteobacteria bacterium]